MLGTYHQSRGGTAKRNRNFAGPSTSSRKIPSARRSRPPVSWPKVKKAEAEKLLNPVKRDFPDDSVAYRMLGDFYFRPAIWTKLPPNMSSLPGAHPKDLEVKKNYVQLLIRSGRPDEARTSD